MLRYINKPAVTSTAGNLPKTIEEFAAGSTPAPR